MRTLVYQHYAQNPWRFQYSKEWRIGGGWNRGGPVFYAVDRKEDDTVPIYQYHATKPWRFQYSANPDMWLFSGKTGGSP